MGTLEIVYAGSPFRIVGRSLEEVQQQIAITLASGNTGWLEAYDGYGSRSPFQLLIAPGVPLALCAVGDDAD